MNKNATITWHPVRLVPYDPVKHAELFDEYDEKPELVWEGNIPSDEGIYLVTSQLRNGRYYVELSEFGPDYAEFETGNDNVIAWAELPEPYVPEDDSDAKE